MVLRCRIFWSIVLYEGESNENLKYVLSRNLLNTKRTRWLHFSMYYLNATCRSLFKPWVSLLKLTRQSSCGSNFYRTFKVFIWLSLVRGVLKQTNSLRLNVNTSMASVCEVACRWRRTNAWTRHEDWWRGFPQRWPKVVKLWKRQIAWKMKTDNRATNQPMPLSCLLLSVLR